MKHLPALVLGIGLIVAAFFLASRPDAARTARPQEAAALATALHTTPVTATVPAAATYVNVTPTPIIQVVTSTPLPAPTSIRFESGRPSPPMLAGMQVRWASVSPDKKWVANGMAALPADGGEEYYTELVVANTNGLITWSSSKMLPMGLGYTTPRPLQWSKDGRYLYYTNRPVPDGCALFVNGSDLLRLDLTSGQVSQIVPAIGLWLSLSPDERTLAYIGYGPRGLVLRDLASDAEREVKLDFPDWTQLGQIVWSPDGNSLALTAAHEPCGSSDWGLSGSVLKVDVKSLNVTTLLARDRRMLKTIEWPTADRIGLEDRANREWWMDPADGLLTLHNPADTPTPTR